MGLPRQGDDHLRIQRLSQGDYGGTGPTQGDVGVLLHQLSHTRRILRSRRPLLDTRHFAVIKPRHRDAFKLLPEQ